MWARAAWRECPSSSGDPRAPARSPPFVHRYRCRHISTGTAGILSHACYTLCHAVSRQAHPRAPSPPPRRVAPALPARPLFRRLPCVFGDYQTGGIISTSFILVWVSIVSLYVPGLLIGAQKNLRRAGKDAETFEAIAYHSIGPRGGMLVQVFICVLQLGICTVFLNYCGTNLYVGTNLHQLSFELWVYVCGAFALMISLGRSVKAFTLFTKLATASMAMALLAVGFFTAQRSILSFDEDRFNHIQYWPPEKTPVQKLVLAFGNLAYTSATGVCLILPIGNALSPEMYGRRYLTIVRLAIGTAIGIFVLLGIGVSLVFAGSKKHNNFCKNSQSITAVFREMADHPSAGVAALPIPDVVLDLINGVLIAAVLLTFPLQIHPAIEVLEKAIGVGPHAANDNSKSREPSPHKVVPTGLVDERSSLLNVQSSGIQSMEVAPAMFATVRVALPSRTKIALGGPVYWRLLRVVLVGLVCTSAAFVPQLTTIISLVGCLTSGMLGMILPVIIDHKIRKQQGLHISWRRYVLGQATILSGVFAITVGNYFTVLELINPPVPPHANHTKHHVNFSAAFDAFDASGPYGGSGGGGAWDMYTGRVGQLHS